MNVEERLALVREVGEEIVTEEELRALLAEKAHPIAYDGFEPSGSIHLAQGVLRAINVNKMTKAGVRFKMFVADWHAWANNKMGGDLAKIQTTGKAIVETWKATGMDLDHVEFVWASEFIPRETYWKKVMNIARDSSLDRILRTTQIMGRSEKDKLSAAQILYPCMQCADIFELGADITQLGMDQRKVNMLAREVGPKLGFWKPVVVSHHMMMGLVQPPPLSDSRQAMLDSLLPIAGPGVVRSVAGTQLLTPEVRARMSAIHDHVSAQPSLALALDAARMAKADIEGITRELRTQPGMSGEQPNLPEYALLHQALDDVVRRLKDQAELETQLRATAMKMSKSNPDSAIFMTDTAEQVTKKLNKAYCPEKITEENPVLEYYRYVIFQRHWANHRTGRAGESPVTIERPEKFGGNATYESYHALAADYAEGKIHPADLKKTAAKYLNDILQPVRDHFEKDEHARKLKAEVESFKVTR
ncbi:MAG: tyrosyl-tRNA synthetase [Thermoplasmata archaeon]|nr:tyrosyl-tRNA synthetase [Thermoplasmata archaeon]